MRTPQTWPALGQTARLAGALAICLNLTGCIGLPLAAAANPLMAVISPLSSAIGMGRGMEMGMRLSQTSAIENATAITPQERAYFEGLSCSGLHDMAQRYTPDADITPDAQSFAMRAVGARLELLAHLMEKKEC